MTSSLTLGHLAQRNGFLCSHKNPYTPAHRRLTHASGLETTQTSLREKPLNKLCTTEHWSAVKGNELVIQALCLVKTKVRPKKGYHPWWCHQMASPMRRPWRWRRGEWEWAGHGNKRGSRWRRGSASWFLWWIHKSRPEINMVDGHWVLSVA